MTLYRTILRPRALAAVALLALAGHADAQHAGYRTLTVAADAPIAVALFYPTAVAARTLPMGPWQPVVATGAPVSEAPLKGLILLSHGTGGTEFNHHNWQDRSMVTSGRYFSERPRQLTRVLDALLASPEWGSRIPADRIGAVGHSAGGYSVLALAGAQAEPLRAAQQCRTVADDPGFCSLAKGPTGPQASGVPAVASASAPEAERVSVPDRRIRAVVALAPMAVVFTPESLAAITVPVRVMVAEQDAVLNGKYHGGYVVANLRRAKASTVGGAGHFAFMAQATIPLPSAAGDAASNPPGFDRMAFLPELENEVAGFFADQWR
jgi:predicted dienelactone hydrolase